MPDVAPPLRSTDWFGKTDKNGFIHRSWLKNQGHPHHMFDGKPVIGICNTWSELTPCNAHLRHLAIDELAQRRSTWQRPTPVAARGYVNLYIRHVVGADRGADLDFLVGASGSRITRDSHYDSEVAPCLVFPSLTRTCTCGIRRGSNIRGWSRSRKSPVRT